MSILKSARNAITGVLDTVSDVAKGAQETVGMGTQFVHHRAVAFQKSDREVVLVALSKTMRELKTELDADPTLAQIHDDLAKELGW